LGPGGGGAILQFFRKNGGERRRQTSLMVVGGLALLARDWAGRAVSRILRNEHGQVPMEYILLAVLVLAIIVTVVIGPVRTAVTGVIARITTWLTCS